MVDWDPEAISFARELDVFPNIIFKAATEGNENIPQNCSLVYFETMQCCLQESRVLWCIDSKSDTLINWSMKVVKKLGKCTSFPNLHYAKDQQALSDTHANCHSLYNQSSTEGKLSLNQDESAHVYLPTYLEAIKLRAEHEAMLFSRRPRNYSSAIAPSEEARIVLNVSAECEAVNICHVNAAWEALTGYLSADVVGQTVLSLQSLGGNSETRNAVVLEASRQAIQCDLDISIALVCRRYSGSPFVGRVRTNALAIDGISVDPSFKYFLSTLTPCNADLEF